MFRGLRAPGPPRGTGFITRFLIAWPGSTQGTRAYRPALETMPQVALFEARIRELLATDAHGCLTPAVRGDQSGAAEWAGVTFDDSISTPEGIATVATPATVARRER